VKAVQVSTTQERVLNVFSKLPTGVKRTLIKPVNNYRLKQVQKLQTPEILMLYVVDTCNLRCKHCFYWKEVDNPRNAHSIEEIEKLSKSFKSPIEILTLTGGEPFVRKDIVEIVRLFVQNNGAKRIHIASNGLTPELIKKRVQEMLAICGDCRITLQFSIDGFEETHDVLRGLKGSFKNVCDSARKLNEIKDERLAVSVATVVFQKNFDQMRDLKKFVNEELGVPMKFNVLRKTSSVKGVPKEHLEDFDIRDEDYQVPTDEQLAQLPDIIDDGSIASRIERKKIEHSIKILSGRRSLNCLGGIRDAVVFSNGDVALCEPTTPFANLKDFDYDFYKLWTSPAAEAKKKAFLGKCACLQSCNLLNAMSYDTETLVNL